MTRDWLSTKYEDLVVTRKAVTEQDKKLRRALEAWSITGESESAMLRSILDAYTSIDPIPVPPEHFPKEPRDVMVFPWKSYRGATVTYPSQISHSPC